MSYSVTSLLYFSYLLKPYFSTPGRGQLLKEILFIQDTSYFHLPRLHKCTLNSVVAEQLFSKLFSRLEGDSQCQTRCN